MSPEFLLAAPIIVSSPGTGALCAIAAGLSRGRRTGATGVFAALGAKRAPSDR